MKHISKRIFAGYAVPCKNVFTPINCYIYFLVFYFFYLRTADYRYRVQKNYYLFTEIFGQGVDNPKINLNVFFYTFPYAQM